MTDTNGQEGLGSLLERVRAATGPDRYIDAELHLISKPRLGAYPYVQTNIGVWAEMSGTGAVYIAPEYTASIDAALALVERVLPGWEWQVRKTGYVELCHPTHHLKDPVGHGSTPALGLLNALLSALQVTP